MERKLGKGSVGRWVKNDGGSGGERVVLSVVFISFSSNANLYRRLVHI
jgi:hypothetical protein